MDMEKVWRIRMLGNEVKWTGSENDCDTEQFNDEHVEEEDRGGNEGNSDSRYKTRIGRNR